MTATDQHDHPSAAASLVDANLLLEPLKAGDVPALFSDVTPIPQPDTPVCRIEYKPDFVAAYDYFRAVAASGEVSLRALRLTRLCLELNPANYTVWQVRRRLLKGLLPAGDRRESLLAAELSMAAELGGSNPKNYQIWYHRRAILESALAEGEGESAEGDATAKEALQLLLRDELRYLETVISADGKNYHAWSHRQWAVGSLAAGIGEGAGCDAVWDSEREYAAQLIQGDVRNNSAWNHRWFAVHRGQADKPLDPAAAFEEEADFALQAAELDPHNESPWRYLVAVVKERIRAVGDAERAAMLELYEQKAAELGGDGGEGEEAVAVPPLAAAVDFAEWRRDADRARELADRLAELDPIRQKYWRWRGQQAAS